MNFKSDKKTYSLTPESIDLVSEDVQNFLTGLKAQKKNIIETRLTVEEILLGFMERFGNEKSFIYEKSVFLGKQRISISVEGDPFNPIEREADDEFGAWSSSFMQNADYAPSYSFNRGTNSILIQFSKKEINPIIKLFGAIIAAVLISLLKYVLPPETIVYLRDSILSQFYNAFLGLMATVEIPLVFLSVICGIIGIGDSTVFGKIGRKMVVRFVVIILFFTMIAGVVFSMLFTKLIGHSSGELSLKVGINLLLDLIPENLAEPIVSGNSMQVVLMAIILGVTIVALGSKAKIVSSILTEGNRIIIYVTSLISKLLPLFIFMVLLNMIWSGNVHTFYNMWKPILAYGVVLVALFSLMLLAVSVKEGVSATLLIKKMLPTFLIGLGTASSIAANGESAETMHKRLGINNRFVEFGQPVGGVVFMPSLSINFMVCAIYMSQMYKVKVSLTWFVIAIIICTFVAIATPPVPGGAVAAYTIIFAQLGIPSESLAVVVTIDILFDFISTAFDGAFLQLELIRQADENKMLDYEVLRGKTK